ncbi:MAG: DUF5717 family protein [Lachnospiraceae bacterium]|nr:DUF5717 family protein [Lachnospiraceae bacterium]
MGEKTIRYLNGEFDYEGGSLIFSCSKIEINLHENETAQGSFVIEEQSGRPMKGSVYSSRMRMHCVNEEFAGTQAEIFYTFDSTGMETGEVQKGNFYVVCDMGEYVLPFVINILHDNLESSMGSIRNLFHFTNLAKSNWDEAVKLFYQDKFLEVFTGNDAKYRNLYRGLKTSTDKNRNLEEFLIGINKKQPIEYILDREEVRVENPEDGMPLTICIERNGWGYTHLSVCVDGEFITLTKNVMTDDDFLGNCCHYTFYIKKEGLHAGRNFGRLLFSHSHGSFCVSVTAVCQYGGKKNHTAHKQKSMTYALTRHYLDFRMKKISLQKWLMLTQELISHRKKIDETNVENSLFEAQLLITQERYNEAKWILDHYIPDPEQLDDTLYCYYLYLTSLYNVDEYYTREAAERVQGIYEKNPDNFRIAWILLYLSGDFHKSTSTKWEFATNLIASGCKSPVFYLEMIQMLNADPLLLKMTQQDKQILWFGAKEQILSLELMQRITYLALREKTYDKTLVRILQAVYEKNPQSDTLQAICLLLMKGSKVGKEYFIWYERAVEQNLQITRLYEYYMMSMDLQSETVIPKRVLMYFSYQSELTVSQNAYLYAYIVKNRQKLGELYEAYSSQIGRFLLKQLYAGKINGNLAYLYQEIIVKEMMTPDNARQLATLLLLHAVTVKDRDITHVIVLDDRLNQEAVYPVINGKAYISLPGNDYTILLQDERGNRYYGSREYATECFFLPRKLIPFVEPYAQDSLALNLFICGNRDLIFITKQNEKRYRYLEEAEAVEKEFRRKIRLKLLSFYFEQDELALLDQLLERIKPEDVVGKERGELVRLLAIRGYYEKAYEWILKFDPAVIEPKTLVKITTYLLQNEGAIENREMTYVIYSAFERGKYNEEVLTYLMNFYQGPVKNLRDIWKAASNFELDTYAICEKIIVQMLETGAFIGEEKQIFKQYVTGCAKPDIELAYLSYCSYEYLVHERLTDEFVFWDVERIFLSQKELPVVCMLAFLKFYADKIKQMQESTKKVCREFLHNLFVCRHIILPFFQEYKEISVDALSISNMTLIEYKGNPDSKVIIHYVVGSKLSEETGYIREEMQNMYGGIFVKPFLLFFGETLQYYVTEEYANKEQLTESGTIQKSDALSDTLQDRYSMINDVAIADTLKDYSAAMHLIEEYEQKKYMTESLFSPQ